MKPWRWILLVFELFLFVLILVLPQVDLPDFAFQRGSAPVVAKSKLSSSPVVVIVTAPVQPLSPQDIVQNQHIGPVGARPGTHSLLSLFCTLLC
jgi:hypothetical protein